MCLLALTGESTSRHIPLEWQRTFAYWLLNAQVAIPSLIVILRVSLLRTQARTNTCIARKLSLLFHKISASVRVKFVIVEEF